MKERLYTAEEKREALRLLTKNNGSAKLTHMEINIPQSTLQSWWKKRNEMRDVDQLRELRQRLIAESLELAIGLKQVSGEAPLNQRATALNQMIDKILKITEVLEEGDSDETQTQTPILRIEYVDEHGQVHSSPPDAETDYE